MPPATIEHCDGHSPVLRSFDTPTHGDNGVLVAVIGVGYVGKQLVESFAARFNVIAFDISSKRLDVLKEELGHDNITYTNYQEDLRAATHFLISVPTLIDANSVIDTSYIRSAVSMIAQVARRGSTVVIESSVAVGMTRSILSSVAASCGLYVGMSPERVDPGRVKPAFESIPKVIAGLDDVVPGSLRSVQQLYSEIFTTLVPVSSPEVAEMTKLYENCQRMMSIAFVNEMADACLQHGIDPYEVSRTAATKPFGYAPYSPSVGVGGHCIPVNPYFLLSNSSFPLLKAATEAMAKRPERIAHRALEYLARPGATKAACGRGKALVAGIGFKSGQSVLSHSPGLALLNALYDSGEVDVCFVDPLVEQAAVPHVARLDEKMWTKASLETFDLIILCVKQPGLNYGLLEELNGVKVDVWVE